MYGQRRSVVGGPPSVGLGDALPSFTGPRPRGQPAVPPAPEAAQHHARPAGVPVPAPRPACRGQAPGLRPVPVLVQTQCRVAGEPPLPLLLPRPVPPRPVGRHFPLDAPGARAGVAGHPGDHRRQGLDFVPAGERLMRLDVAPGEVSGGRRRREGQGCQGGAGPAGQQRPLALPIAGPTRNSDHPGRAAGRRPRILYPRMLTWHGSCSGPREEARP